MKEHSISQYTIKLHHNFPNHIGYRLKRLFVTRLQYWRSTAVSTSKPSYLAELVSTHTPARELRYSSRRPNQLNVPNVKTTLGSRAFRHAAPAVWNSLPSTVCSDIVLSLETFTSRLKTFLYYQSFRCWSCYRSTSAIRRHRRRHIMRYDRADYYCYYYNFYYMNTCCIQNYHPCTDMLYNKLCHLWTFCATYFATCKHIDASRCWDLTVFWLVCPRTWSNSILVGRCGVVGSTLAFGSIGHGFESEHRLFSHYGASTFSKLT